MSTIKPAILDSLVKHAVENSFMQEKLAAAIVRNGKVISIGVNSKKTHPLQARFRKNEHAIFLHAEIDAIKKALGQMNVDDFSRCDIYIARAKKLTPIDTEHSWGLSRPCPGCLRAIMQFGFKRIIYTTESGNPKIIEL